MCGRYVLNGSPVDIKTRFQIKSDLPFFRPHFNVTPGMMMPVITADGSENKAVLAKWGLIPSWAKDPNIGYKMINARSETILEKPSYKKPFMEKRCLIPASGFYEWMRLEKEKIPYFIKLKSADIFSMAGIYDIWKDAEGKSLISFTIITTIPNQLMEKIHNRMPVIIPANLENKWLDLNNRNMDDLTGMLISYNGKDMDAYPVSKMVNSPENDSTELIQKI